MITQQFRPTTFDEVVGQDLNVKILKSLVAKPEEAPRSLILYGEYGCGKCVPGDIRILTENGYLKIGDYCKGIDEGFTECKGETEGRFGKDKIVAKYFEKEALVRTVNLNVNNNVRGTLRHKVLAFKDGEIGLFPLGNLKIGDYILFPKKPIEFKHAKHCPDLAYAQAVWLSDGWCSRDRTAAGYCGSLKACQKFKRIVGWSGKLSKDKRKEDVYNIRSSLKDKMNIEIMHGAGNKYVPEWVFNTDVETRKAFIQGLFDTDGCISKNQFELMSKSEKLVKGYQELFMSLGVATKIIPKTLTTGHYKGNVYYKIYIKNHSLQDFKWTSRQFILEDKNTANSRNTIAVTRRMTEELEHYVKGRKTSKVRSVLSNLRAGRCVTERTLINLKNELGYLPSCFDELIGYTYAKILSYTDTVEDVYDITTEKYHEFYAQGTYNHNTTCARIFAREINHDNTVDLDTTPYYMELDSAAMGSIDHIRELRDTFAYSSGSFYKIVVFDECHLLSSASQAALLKIIEEAPKKVFFIFATTNPEKLLKTIRSRSIELKFDGISKEEMFKNLKNISQELNKEVPDNVIDVICKRSRGHMRNAHMLLDKYFLIGHDAFVQSVRTAHPYIYLFLESIAKKDKETCFKAIDSILKFPLVTVQQDFQEVLADMTKAMVNYPPYAEQSKKINSLFGANTLKIIKFLLAPWILEDSFKSDLELQTVLLCVFQILTKSLR